MGGRLVFVVIICAIAGSAAFAQDPASVEHEIMLKLLLQNRELDIVSLDRLVIILYKTDADSAELNALRLNFIQKAAALNLVTPLHFLTRNTFESNSGGKLVAQAVFLLNSPTISLRQLGRNWHRLGVLTFTNMPDQMDDGIAIAVAPDSLGQQKIFMNPRALERAKASFSTEILQLTTTRYAKGSGL